VSLHHRDRGGRDRGRDRASRTVRLVWGAGKPGKAETHESRKHRNAGNTGKPEIQEYQKSKKARSKGKSEILESQRHGMLEAQRGRREPNWGRGATRIAARLSAAPRDSDGFRVPGGLAMPQQQWDGNLKSQEIGRA
jgi:hypothetical protein